MSVSAGALPVPAGDPLAADDPQGAVRQALAAPLDPPLAAEDVVLAWLLRLPDGIDPARAAGRILAAAPTSVGDARLSGLLAEIACWPAERLPCGRRHRPTLPQ